MIRHEVTRVIALYDGAVVEFDGEHGAWLGVDPVHLYEMPGDTEDTALDDLNDLHDCKRCSMKWLRSKRPYRFYEVERRIRRRFNDGISPFSRRFQNLSASSDDVIMYTHEHKISHFVYTGVSTMVSIYVDRIDISVQTIDCKIDMIIVMTL